MAESNINGAVFYFSYELPSIKCRKSQFIVVPLLLTMHRVCNKYCVRVENKLVHDSSTIERFRSKHIKKFLALCACVSNVSTLLFHFISPVVYSTMCIACLSFISNCFWVIYPFYHFSSVIQKILYYVYTRRFYLYSVFVIFEKIIVFLQSPSHKKNRSLLSILFFYSRKMNCLLHLMHTNSMRAVIALFTTKTKHKIFMQTEFCIL